MNIVFGVFAGLVWGSLAAFVNYKINQAALKKNSEASMLGATVGRMGVDFVTLAAVFLLRKKLPFSFEATIIAAAIALSLLNVILSYWMIRTKK